MTTELAFILLSIVSMSFALIAFKLGKIWLIAFTAVSLVLANLVGPKVVSVFGFAITAGTPIFAGLPIATDLLTEKYGRKVARQAVYTAFFAMAFFSIIGAIALQMKALVFAEIPSNAIDVIFSTSARLMVASPIAYLVWQLIDIRIYHMILLKTGEKMLWLRNNISTLIAQAGSTFTFFFLGFHGTGQPWVEIAVVTVAFYWVIALFDTTIVYVSKSVTPNDILEKTISMS